MSYILVLIAGISFAGINPVLRDTKSKDVEKSLLSKEALKGINGYKALIKKNPKYETSLTRNLYKMYHRHYVSSGSYYYFVKTLNKNLTQKKHESLSKGYFNKLIHTEIKNKKTTLRKNISLIRKYIPHTNKKVYYHKLIAQIATKKKAYKTAISEYERLATEIDSKKASYYYALAIKNQELRIKTSHKPDFDKKVRRSAKLTSLYEKYLALVPNNWTTRSKHGLQLISSGSQLEAFSSWKENMNARSSYAKRAAGYMILSHSKNNEWQDVEVFIKDLKKKKMTAKGLKKKQNDYLADALYYQGKESYNANDFVNSELKLLELVNNHRRSDKREHGLYLLSFSYRKNAKQKESLDTMNKLLNQYPNSKHTKSALITMATWTRNMALENKAISYYQRYEKAFGSKDIYDDLLALYQGRELYSQANRLLREKVKSGDESAAHNLLTNSFYYGTQAQTKSDILLVQKHVSHLDIANYYRAKIAYDEADDKTLGKMLKKLNGIYEYQKEIELLVAHRSMIFQDKEIYSLELKNPASTLRSEMNQFNYGKKQFDIVCEGKLTSHCASAQLEVIKYSEIQSDRIKGLSIAESLAKKDVDRFNKLKTGFLSQLNSYQTSYKDASLQTVSSIHANPMVTDSVLWVNSRDWNFDRITGEVRNGFVQKEVR